MLNKWASKFCKGKESSTRERMADGLDFGYPETSSLRKQPSQMATYRRRRESHEQEKENMWGCRAGTGLLTRRTKEASGSGGGGCRTFTLQHVLHFLPLCLSSYQYLLLESSPLKCYPTFKAHLKFHLLREISPDDSSQEPGAMAFMSAPLWMLHNNLCTVFALLCVAITVCSYLILPSG